MPSLASISSLPKTSRTSFLGRRWPRRLLVSPQQTLPYRPPLNIRTCTIVASASPSFDGHDGRRLTGSSRGSILSNMIQEIEPLDVSLIQKDVPVETIDAMKRTISSMLGLLPSDQFHVHIEAFWEPLSKLLVSSMMTGYTLRNAEYRLCLERNLGVPDEIAGEEESYEAEFDGPGTFLDGTSEMFRLQNVDLSTKTGDVVEEACIVDLDIEDLGELPPQVHEYIRHLKSRLSSVKKEMHDLKRETDALQMQHFVGEEKNDLLDYLRSLHPEKVAELSEPACPELRETVHSIVHGLLATLSPKMQTKAPPQSENPTAGAMNTSANADDCAELVENTSLNFQPLISVSRDYLARLLFWCMLLGHYIRGLEYRLELMQLLAIPSGSGSGGGGEYAA
ncbi:MAR-binding filament-like protein [Wolffia australiana]